MNPSSDPNKRPSICLVHDWLVAMRGGEKVLEALAELFPEAPIYTLFVERERLSSFLQNRTIHTSFLQKIPGISKWYRWFLPLFPIAIWTFNLKRYDVIFSSSHCVAKAAKGKRSAIRVCYCHTPMRYLWGFSEEYLGKFPFFIRWFIDFYFQFLKKWDVATAQRVNYFVANSKNTQNRINRFYRKEAAVVYPPVSPPNENAHTEEDAKGTYFLMVSALVPYKRIDLAIEAFKGTNLQLKIVGDGPLRKELERTAGGSNNIKFLGWADAKNLSDQYANAKALIFPGEEDFGIVPVEAQLFGKPVIALGKGGATESVLALNDQTAKRPIDLSTGLFFYEDSPQALRDQIMNFETLNFNPTFIRAHANGFGKERFQEEILAFLEEQKII